ncbi:MAG: response regulator [Proteobacteria bacterium]|nr:response regulator [Pseudomonadota bacterium]MCH8213167.1 response regulator [Pseudomonadota bacterium]
MTQNQLCLESVSFLIVDPNAFMRSLIKNVLHVFGAEKFSEANDGADAFKAMQNLVPDIIITEWMMEPLDGLDFTRLVRTGKDSLNPFVPIIMMTAYSEKQRVVEARDAGITEFIAKPLSAKTLMARVTAVIEHPRPFIRSPRYFGPDRRRRESSDYKGPERRKSVEDGEGANLSQEEVEALLDA